MRLGEPSWPQCVRGDLPMTRGTFHTGLVPTRAAGGGRAGVPEGGGRRACGLGLSPPVKSSWNARRQTSWPVSRILTWLRQGRGVVGTGAGAVVGVVAWWRGGWSWGWGWCWV